MDRYPITARSLEKYYGIDGDRFERQYKDHLSSYRTWDQLGHAEEWILYPGNIGPRLSVDETGMSNGELYTIVTNKSAGGRKGALVAMIRGTKSEDIISVINRVPLSVRQTVTEITLDMAGSMSLIARRCFPNAVRVIDRFHVQKLAYDALQEIRIRHRWDAINEETDGMENARLDGKEYVPALLENGDTLKQLLFRSRYLLFKSPEKWSESQRQRAAVLFRLYPDISQAYWLVHRLRVIYNSTRHKGVAYTKLARWFNDVTNFGDKAFNTISATIYTHYPEILNFFDNRSTNASAESFNAKIKSFRAALHGVADLKFFLFRLANIYA